MTNEKQIEVVKKFISLHMNNNVDDWLMMCSHGTSLDEKYLEIYSKLEGGMFGDVHDNAEYDDDGEMVSSPTEFETEISQFESITSSPVVFCWTAE